MFPNNYRNNNLQIKISKNNKYKCIKINKFKKKFNKFTKFIYLK